MDNRHIDITARNEEDFNLAMQIICRTEWGSRKVVGFAVEQNTFVLYWTKADKMQPLPYDMTPQQITAFVWGWLQGAQPIDREPDHDGDNKKGFRVFNEAWGHVFNQSQAFAGITPVWAMYGK